MCSTYQTHGVGNKSCNPERESKVSYRVWLVSADSGRTRNPFYTIPASAWKMEPSFTETETKECHAFLTISVVILVYREISIFFAKSSESSASEVKNDQRV